MDKEEQTIYHISGSIAASVSRVKGDRITTVFGTKGNLLLLFNQNAIGSVQYANGKPWLVLSDEGWTVSSLSGNILERGSFPRRQTEPVVCDVTEHLSVRFQDKYNLEATLRIGETKTVLQCGERLKRSNLGVNLDVASIRQRQKESGPSGSVYVSPGPHHFKTDAPGVGALKATLRALPANGLVTTTVQDLQRLDDRIGSIDTRNKIGGGGGRAGGRASAPVSPASTGKLSASMTRTMGGRGKPPPPEDFGSPEMSESMKRNAVRPQQQEHKGKRKSLPRRSQAEVLAGICASSSAPPPVGVQRDELVVLALLADWNPVCKTLEAQVQRAYCEVCEEAEAGSASPSSRIKMFKVDASEGSLLQNKYGFRSVPMFFFFFEGRLVQATNALRLASEIKDAALAALMQGRRKVFLADGFTFDGKVDNTSLDYIKSSMSFLG